LAEGFVQAFSSLDAFDAHFLVAQHGKRAGE
jgi:hypothetical protein